MLHSSALCPYSTKAKSRVKSTISVLLWRHFQSNFRTCLQNSSNQDLYVLMPTVPKVTHNGQESTFPWHASSPCPEYAPIRFVRYRISDFTLLCFVPIQHESEKHGEKHGFCVICVSLVELWWVSKRSNCKQSQALFTKKRSFHDQLPECALLCLEHCRFSFSLSHATVFRMNTHQERKTHAI